MPNYIIENTETGEVNEVFLTLAEREELLKDPKFKQHLSVPNFITQHGLTVNKVSGGWKDVLSRVKSGAAKNHTIKD